MKSGKTEFDSNVPSVEAAIAAAVEHLGGEPLAGSGFEHETPEPDFQFEWALPIDQPEGGLR
jgi:hypothetical protein